MATKAKVSKRDYLDASGEVTKDMESAAGGRYALEGGKAFDYIFGKSVDTDRMFAIFGFHTKVGNVANSVLNNKDAPGDMATAGDAIAEFLDLLEGGAWTNPSAGGFAKIDRDKLAEAIFAVAVATGKAQASDTAYRDRARAKLESDKKFLATVRKVDAIAKEYARLVGAQEISVDDALAGLDDAA